MRRMIASLLVRGRLGLQRLRPRWSDPATPRLRTSGARGPSFGALVSGTIAACAVAIGAPAAGCTPGGGGVCECVPCVFAVTLSVFEEGTGAPLDVFAVDVALNDENIGQPLECDENARTANTCSFGIDSGLYQMVVSSPGHHPREAAVRLADQAGAQCCNGACLRAKQIDVFLEPLQ